MKIIILDSKNRKIELNVSDDLTIREVKEKYYSALGDFRRVNFKYDGEVLRDDKQLCDYGIEDYDCIVSGLEYRGGGGVHICPYGCGREIPDNYKGCTELLKDHPDYF